MITFVPLYKWNSFNQAQFDSFCSIATKVFEDQINHYEYAENRMCIEENLSDELYNLRANYNGLNLLFEIGQVHCSEHQTYLEDITYDIIKSTSDTELDISIKIKKSAKLGLLFLKNLRRNKRLCTPT